MRYLLFFFSCVVAFGQATPLQLRVFTNYIDMVSRANPSNVNKAVLLLGGTATNDGLGGIFLATTNFSSTNSNDIIRDQNYTNWAWNRISISPNQYRSGEPVNVKSFGAIPDDGLDDTAAFQAADDYVSSGNRRGSVFVPRGQYDISSVTIRANWFTDGTVNRGNRIDYSSVLLKQVAGATNAMFVVAGDGVYRKSVTIEGFVFLGRPETNVRNLRSITNVTSRLEFQIDGGVPTYTPAGSYPYYGWGAVYSDEQRFIGTVMIETVNTNTGALTIRTNTDNYVTEVGASGLLLSGYKIALPQELTLTNYLGTTTTQFSSAAGGYAAIDIRNASGTIIRDCLIHHFYAGIVNYLDDTLVIDRVETYGCHLAGVVNGFTSYGSDWYIEDFIHEGAYIAEYGLAAETNVYENLAYRCAVSGLLEMPVQSTGTGKIVSGTSVYGLVATLADNSDIDLLSAEGCIRSALFVTRGAPSQRLGALVVKRIAVSDRANSVPAYRTNTAIIDINGTYAQVIANEITLGRWPGSSNTWTWDYIYNVQNATGNSLEIGNVSDPASMVLSDKHASSIRALHSIHANTIINGGSSASHVLELQRDGVARFGQRITAGSLQTMIDDNDDGTFETYPIFSLNNDSGNRIIVGNPSGAASARTGIVTGEDGSGTDIVGAPLVIASGRSTGAATPATVQIQSTATGSSGTTLQTRVTALTISQTNVSVAGGLTVGATNVIGSLAGKSDTGHTHGAADITSGTVATARLGSGTANSTTYLRGDSTWQTISASGGGETNTASNLGTGYGLWYDKSGVDLRFNSISNGIGVTVSSNANLLTIRHNVEAGANITLSTNSGALVITSTGGAGSGDDVYVNGANVTHPDFDDSSTAIWSVNNTNVTVYPTNLANAQIASAAAIDATKIADGSVSSTEFQYISTVTSDVQTQINGKQASFTTGVGVTNVANVLSANFYPSNNITFSTNEYGRILISATGGGSALTVREEDGSPSDTAVTVIRVTNGTLTDNGAGDVSIATGGGGSGDSITVDGAATVDPNFDDGGDINFTYSSPNITADVKANSVALGTDTTGNYVTDVAGTANEVTVTHTPAEGSTATVSLPATIDLGGKTSFEIPNAAAPTTDAAGEIALDTTITDHQGLLQYYDGSDEMLVVAIKRTGLTTTDNHIISYDAATGTFLMEAASGGSTYNIVTPLPVQSAKLPSTDPAQIDASSTSFKLLYDDTTTNSATWFHMSPDWNGTTQPVVKLFFKMTSATSGAVTWGVSLLKGDTTDDFTVETGYDTENTGNASVLSDVDFVQSLSITITNDDGIGSYMPSRIRIRRLPGDASDTASGDAELVGASIIYER